MPTQTTIDDVEQAVIAVRQLQEQVAGLLTAVKRLTVRLERVEARMAKIEQDG